MTEADLRANRCIVEGLAAMDAHIPVVTEELPLSPFAERRHWQRYWLVDPLDGTKEFIGRNGQFTVNIALIDRGHPVLGVVYVPVTGLVYTGLRGLGAYKVCGSQQEVLTVRGGHCDDLRQRSLDILVSRHYGGAVLEGVCRHIASVCSGVNPMAVGSSLKFCLIAAGQADFYPRLGPTSEWDTAAAQAVLEAAGGHVVDSHWQPLRYNQKDSMLNPPFYALGGDIGEWQRLLQLAEE